MMLQWLQRKQHTAATSTTYLSIFLHECPEVQDVCPTLTSSLDTCLGILTGCRVEAIERTSWKIHEEALVNFVGLELKNGRCDDAWTTEKRTCEWVLPFKMHSFSQDGSWTGGGVMKITLFADTPAEARSLVISFRFSEYSCTGTCCWGFLSAWQE